MDHLASDKQESLDLLTRSVKLEGAAECRVHLRSHCSRIPAGVPLPSRIATRARRSLVCSPFDYVASALCYSRSSDIDFTTARKRTCDGGRTAGKLIVGWFQASRCRSFRIVALWVEVYEGLIRQQCRFTLTSLLLASALPGKRSIGSGSVTPCRIQPVRIAALVRSLRSVSGYVFRRVCKLNLAFSNCPASICFSPRSNSVFVPSHVRADEFAQA